MMLCSLHSLSSLNSKLNNMIISSLEELRLHIPANAIDNIASMTGFISASEYDTLRDKLGKTLYNILTTYYSALDDEDKTDLILKIQDNEELSPNERLLILSQRIVAFDAIGNAVGTHVVSINGAGINTMSADDYAAADDKMVEKFQSTCRTECHKAINILLETLEDWVKDYPGVEDEHHEIIEAWKESNYYFLANGMLIPSAQVLQQYLNIYDNREKFILMLPDIRYIQEEILGQAIGEDFMDYLAKVAIEGTSDRILARIINRLRKAFAAHLESRTLVLRTDKDRRVAAHNEAISLTDQAVEYIVLNQTSLSSAALRAFKTSALYVPETETEIKERKFENNRSGNAFFATPGLR